MKLANLAILTLFTFGSTSATAALMTFSNEADYLSALSGYSLITEGFESTDWNDTRHPSSISSLTSQGLIWSASDNLSTGTGWTHSGSYGLFDSYGDPDQISVSGTETLFGVGGYFRSTTATLFDYSIDGTYLGSNDLTPVHSFFGIIDTNGFDSITFLGNGHYGADDFTVAVSSSAVPEPSILVLLGAGLVGISFVRRRKQQV
jgi:hypothetical protein